MNESLIIVLTIVFWTNQLVLVALSGVNAVFLFRIWRRMSIGDKILEHGSDTA